MHTYTQRLFIGSFRSISAANLIPRFLVKSSKVLMHLFSPEDTTDKETGRPLHIAGHSTHNINGLAKAVFWIVISLSIALLLGRLS